MWLTGQPRPARREIHAPTSAPASAAAAPTTTPCVKVRASPPSCFGGVKTVPARVDGGPDGGGATVDGPGGRREAPDGSGAPPPAGVPATTPEDRRASTLAKNSSAIRFETPVNMRCPTPPIIPPTTASAS